MHSCVCVFYLGEPCADREWTGAPPAQEEEVGTAPWGGGPSTPCSVAPAQLPLPCSSARGSPGCWRAGRGVWELGTGCPRAQEWGAHSLPLPACKGSICVCGSSVPVFMLASAPQVRCPCCARPRLCACLCACAHVLVLLILCVTMNGSAGEAVPSGHEGVMCWRWLCSCGWLCVTGCEAGCWEHHWGLFPHATLCVAVSGPLCVWLCVDMYSCLFLCVW